MPPDKNQNINLIPSELERKRQVIKQVIAQAPREYTEAKNGQVLSRPSFWSRYFTRKNAGKSQTSATEEIYTVKLDRLPSRAAPKKEAAISAPKPDFLAAAQIAPAAPKPAIIQPVKPEPPPLAKKEEVKAAPVKKELPPAKKKIEMTEAQNGGPKKIPAGEDFGVNLLSGEYAQAFAAQNQKSFFAYTAGAAVALVVAVYLVLFLYQMQKSKEAASAQAANSALAGAINDFNDLDKEDKLLGRKVSVIKELLNSHVSTRTFLEKLESITIPEVTFLALAAAQDGGVTITARAASYTALARQLTVLQESAPWIKEVSVASAGLVRSNQGAEEGVEFDMSLQVDPKVFKAEANQ